MFGDGNSRDSGGVGHRDAVAGGGRQVDVVHPRAPHGYEAQARTGCEDPPGEFGRGANVQHHLRRADSLNEAFFRAGKGIMVVELGARYQAGPHGAGTQQGRGVVGDGNSGHLQTIVAKHHPPVAQPSPFQL
jgi:hypothetical protein